MRQEQAPELFKDLTELPEHLQIPTWLGWGIIVVAILGLGLGYATEAKHPAEAIGNCVFFSSAFTYLFMSLLDFYEHFRIEKQLTGSYFGMAFVPFGETVNHGITTAIIVALFVLARPLTFPLEMRDYVLLALPGLFLFFGIRDEVKYHRRRSDHREDIMHTVSHLSAGVMLASYMAVRLIDWQKLV
jgi:hypothetical protein